MALLLTSKPEKDDDNEGFLAKHFSFMFIISNYLNKYFPMTITMFTRFTSAEALATTAKTTKVCELLQTLAIK